MVPIILPGRGPFASRPASLRAGRRASRSSGGLTSRTGRRAVEAERDAADLHGPAQAADRSDRAVVDGRVERPGQRQLQLRLVVLGRAGDQPVRHPGERHPRHAAVAGAGPAGERRDRGGGHQVPGRMVQDRQRPPVRRAGAGPGAAGQGQAGAVLHQGVEAPAGLPRPGPAVGVEGDLDEARRDGLPQRGAEPQGVERAGTQAVYEQVRSGEQFREPGLPAGGLQVERRAALAEGEVAAADAARLVVVRRIDPQHLRAEPGEQSRRHRAGQHAGQVEDADPGERALGYRLPVAFPAARRGDVDQWLVRHGRSLGVGGPLPGGPAGRGGTAAGDDGRLQFVGLRPGDGRGQLVAVFAGAEDGEGGGTQVRVVRLEPDPAPVRRAEVP